MTIGFDLAFLKKNRKSNVFFETGLHIGTGVKQAVQAGFNKIYSIEISSIYYDNGLKTFEKEIKENKVILIKDDSKNLYDYIKKINEPILFWLDAHNDQSNKHEQGTLKCPLIKELEEIGKHPIKNHTILIDDIRIIKKNSWGENSVTIKKIIDKIKTINKDYKFTYLKGHVPDDILMAYI